mmetsp:Transcript_25178/g.100246  ORF Transcript_25178/g.100246 Transcript_25178/m.100246 type:complete len:232 (-) Transcript_25178:69-764(-)
MPAARKYATAVKRSRCGRAARTTSAWRGRPRRATSSKYASTKSSTTGSPCLVASRPSKPESGPNGSGGTACGMARYARSDTGCPSVASSQSNNATTRASVASKTQLSHRRSPCATHRNPPAGSEHPGSAAASLELDVGGPNRRSSTAAAAVAMASASASAWSATRGLVAARPSCASARAYCLRHVDTCLARYDAGAVFVEPLLVPGGAIDARSSLGGSAAWRAAAARAVAA